MYVISKCQILNKSTFWDLEETIAHIVCECVCVKLFWNELCTYLSDKTDNLKICINTLDIILFYYYSNFRCNILLHFLLFLVHFFIHKCIFLGKNSVL